MTRTEPGRNDPCPCGSGKKYKRCCLAVDTAARIPRDPYTGGTFSRDGEPPCDFEWLWKELGSRRSVGDPSGGRTYFAV